MLVSAAAKHWDVDPASCRAQARGASRADPGDVRVWARLPPTRRACRSPRGQLKPPEDSGSSHSVKRLDTPAKVNGTAVYRTRARRWREFGDPYAVAGVRRPRCARRYARAKAVKGVPARIAASFDDPARVADEWASMGSPQKKGLAALVIASDDGPHVALDTQAIAGELERRRSIREWWRRTSAMWTRPW